MQDIPNLQHPVAAAADQGVKSSQPAETSSARRRLSRVKERFIEALLFLAAFSSVAITLGIVGTLIFESSTFFAHVSIKRILNGAALDTVSSLRLASASCSLVLGTLVTTAVALAVALPIGTVVAIYLSEFAPPTVREVIKPALELLSAVPTVVYGYFALQFMSPLLQKLLPGLPTFNMLSAGVVMGIMIIPYVSSLSEDAMRAVPMSLREGAYAMGANRIITAVTSCLSSGFVRHRGLIHSRNFTSYRRNDDRGDRRRHAAQPDYRSARARRHYHRFHRAGESW